MSEMDVLKEMAGLRYGHALTIERVAAIKWAIEEINRLNLAIRQTGESEKKREGRVK
jgi:hypothetical protein